MRTQSGFTLVEVVVVVAIISLLVSIALVSADTSKNRAVDARKKVEAHQVKTALSLYHNSTGRMPKNYSRLGGVWVEGRATIATQGTDGGYERSMQELVDAGFLGGIPVSPGGDPYAYYDYGQGNVGAIFGTTLATGEPTVEGAPESCRPFDPDNGSVINIKDVLGEPDDGSGIIYAEGHVNLPVGRVAELLWCSKISSNNYCVCNPY